MAMADAGLESVPPDTAVVMATAYGAASVTERILRQLMLESPEAVSPALFTESVANAPAAQVALALEAKGANVTVTQREAGALIAIGSAAAAVRRGKASMALAGAVEELNPLIHSILDRFGALAPAGPDGTETARPFDRRRHGFIAGEGATLVTIETEEMARRRGATLLARLRMNASAFDPSAGPTGHGTGAETLAAALGDALGRAGLEPGSIDHIVSSASGSRGGDRLEAEVLRAVWGALPLPPILVPKAVTGEHGAGLLSGAVLATCGNPFGPTPGFEVQDPALGITPHDGRPLPPPRRLLITGLAAGGTAAWLVLEAVTL
jgi:3-oxoacyl-(acyl-carrier-protein) synthase